MKAKTKPAATKKAPPMIVLTEDQRDLLNNLRYELELKNQNEALQVLINVATAHRGKGKNDTFVAAGTLINSGRERAKAIARKEVLQAELAKLEEMEASLPK